MNFPVKENLVKKAQKVTNEQMYMALMKRWRKSIRFALFRV